MTKRVKNRNNKTVKLKKRNNTLYFPDFPEFRPNLTPTQMFEMGSFGGTYWRPIYSSVNKKNYKNVHKKYPWFRDIPKTLLTERQYDKNKNKYKVKVGTTLEFWESKQWITQYHPYGWVHWYCDFCMGKRCPDDKRQVDRWSALTGKNGRFKKFLITQIVKKKKEYDDITVSPKIRQVLQHWGYKLTKSDFDDEINERKKK